MTTFSHEVSPYRRKDGTYLIKFRIIHNRRTLRKPSGIYASSEQLTRDRGRIRDPALLEAVQKAVDRLRMAAARVEGAEYMDAETLWQRLTARLESEKGFRLDFVAFGTSLTAGMEKGTADGYKYALRAFCAFLGRDSVDINEIDRRMVDGFREWIERRNGKGCRSASAYLEKLRYIHTRARLRYNDDEIGLVCIPRQPFKTGTIPPQPTTKHRALTLDQLRRVLSASPKSSRGKLALDVFALSFYLIGMNTADLYALRKSDLSGNVLTYRRAKTDSRRQDHAEIQIRVEPEAEGLVRAYKGQKTLLSFADRYADFRGFNKAVNAGLKELGQLAGVPGLNSGYARHTWATLARNACKIPRDTVGECLNHAPRGRERVDDIYIARDFTRIWEANRQVLDLLKTDCRIK